ncbi:hypothetical protein KM031_21365 (plasmid) [Gemmobacter fulvus]|uniref:Uncharacterized protein n=1 Tax=Gemmobacter fulvus TaxID=2840474 RepID=A0A975PAY1_9RHOB|nr:hypothetical protein [Gemmobacter fulvus]MBT9247770.1 hypothetical protein [Gemmobacter fulvus]QWK92980.1 hypothetical protein KM031_21365 [Gemmobacter fulvus]
MYETVKLQPGLLTLTFVAPAEGSADALIRPVVMPASRQALSLMFEAGNVAGALTSPGEFCVIRCGRPAVLGIEISARQTGAMPRGGIELNYLSRRGPDPAPDETTGADYILHLAGHGDRPASFGSWTGGDTPDQAIAGLMIRARTGRPRIVAQDPATGQIAQPGDFLGSRGGFRPFSELQLWIDEPDGRYRLGVEAEFAEAGRVSASGTMVSLHGMSTGDRLLRLRMVLEQMSADSEKRATARRNDRIRIFRKG